MATGSSLGRRIQWTLLIVVVLVVVIGVGEILRRYFIREELAAIHRTLHEVRLVDDPLEEIDPTWGRHSKSLHARIDEDPTGPLAILTPRAVIRVEHDLRGSISLASRTTATVRYGDLVGREIPFADQPYHWTIEIEGSWDTGEWFPWHHDTWGGEQRSSRAKLDLRTGLTGEQLEKDWVRLNLRAMLKLYVAEAARKAAVVSGADGSASVPHSYQEQRKLGSFKIWTGEVGAGSGKP